MSATIEQNDMSSLDEMCFIIATAVCLVEHSVWVYFNPCHVEYFAFPIFNMSILGIPIITMHLHEHSEWKTVWIPISQKPANLDLQCFLNRMYLNSAGQGLSSEKLASLNLSLLCRETSSTINDLIFAHLSLIIMTS